MSCRVYEGEPVLLARGRQGSRVEFGRGEGEESVGTVSRKGGKVAVRCAWVGSLAASQHRQRGLADIRRCVRTGGFIREAGGHHRINGNLNLSRSLGDLKYKQNAACSPVSTARLPWY